MNFNFELDLWTVIGLVSQGFFFLRFVIQWFVSEKEQKSTIPNIFWYLSFTGAILITIYAIGRGDIVFLCVGILQIGIYSRNIIFSLKNKRAQLLN